MKTGNLLFTAALLLTVGVATAGRVESVDVAVDLDNNVAFGDQWTARSADGDVDYIGCGTRVFDDGVDSFSFAFCQAGDAEENTINCFTTNPDLIDAIEATSAFAFITFRWIDEAGGGATCTRVGFSTQSIYLPNFVIDDDGDSDSDSDD